MDHALEQLVGPVLVRLMRGVLYRDEQPDLWQVLYQHQAPAMDYLHVIGLELQLDESEGFAYLRQCAQDGQIESEEERVGQVCSKPHLIERRPLSYPVSLLCVLLRKQLVEHDAGGDQPRLIVTRDEITEMMRVFLPHQSNEARIIEKIDTHIDKIESLGFLRKLKGQQHTYEVRRIIKALVDATWLADLNEKLEVYRGHAEPTA